MVVEGGCVVVVEGGFVVVVEGGFVVVVEGGCVVVVVVVVELSVGSTGFRQSLKILNSFFLSLGTDIE